MNFLNFLTAGASRTHPYNPSLQLQPAKYDILQQKSTSSLTTPKTRKLTSTQPRPANPLTQLPSAEPRNQIRIAGPTPTTGQSIHAYEYSTVKPKTINVGEGSTRGKIEGAKVGEK